MSSYPTRATRAVAITATAAVLAGLAGCSTGPASPGITAETIRIGTHVPLTGPAASSYASIPDAVNAWFSYVNDHGGVNGRQIEYIVKDDAYDPKLTQQVVQELVEDDEVFAILGGLGTPTHTAVVDYLNTKRVPDLFVASGDPRWNDAERYPYTFGFNPDYIIEAKVLAQYAQQEFGDDAVFCVLGQGDEFGRDFGAGLELTLGDDALAVEESYQVTDADVVQQVAAMQQAGCTVNFLATVTGFTAMTIGTAAKMGYRAHWVSSNVGGEYQTLAKYLGEAAPLLLEGFVTSNYLPNADGDPWVELFRQVNADYNEGAAFDANTMFGMSMAYTFTEALTKAGDNPSRDDLVAALQSGRVLGNGIFPLTLSDASHAAYTGVQVAVVHNGVQAYVESPYITSDGEGAIVEYIGKAVTLPNEDGLPLP